jgi:SAM-dependent methyltransferase
MKQNIYDDPRFLEGYRTLRRVGEGLKAAPEFGAFRSMLPELKNLRVLDLGCGYGFLCQYLRDHGAASVVGVDISTKMLEGARREHADPRITYINCAIEDAEFDTGSFDLVTSSLALHYVERYDQVCANVARWLASGGTFAFSVEHPIVTADQTGWCKDEQGRKRHWAVDNYRAEGRRDTHWFVDGVIKYHRTLESYLNTLIDCGFSIFRVLEPDAPEDFVRQRPELAEEARRPLFLLTGARRSA